MNSRIDGARAATERASARSGRAADLVDVAVVGGGLVGAAAALAAGQAGLSVVWVVGDARIPAVSGMTADAPRDARVYALGPPTRRFLEQLRVWPQLDATRMAPVLDMHVFGDGDARTAIHFDAYSAATERLATIVEHRDLVRVLDAAAAFFPGIERIGGVVSSVVAEADHVTLTTSAGVRQARLVVAADGASSPTRDALGIGTDGRPYGQHALVGNFRLTRPHAGAAFQWFTDDGVVALLPLAATADEPNAMSLVWSAPDAVAAGLAAGGADAVAARLTLLCALRPETAVGPVLAAGPLASIPLQLQWARQTIADRAVLIGDAAHVIHPLAGQGLNLGFGDVESLIDVLASRESFRDCGDRTLLRRHERRRAEPIAAMRRTTDGLQRLFASNRRDVAALRGAGLRLVDRIEPLKRLLMRQAARSPIAD